MINLVLIVENEHERSILTIAFQQYGINVLHSEAKYKNYVFVLQFMPDIIVMELPYYCVEQLNFSERVRAFGRTKGIPIVGYGNTTNQSVIKGMVKKGISVYMQRPLKFTILLKHVEHLLHIQKKTLEQKPEATNKEQDTAAILDPSISPVQKIEIMAHYVAKLMAFPFTVAKVLEVTQDEASGAQQLTKAVSTDPSIATYILKIANTVFFSSANRRITSIKDAIIRIGFNETKRIVLGMSVISLFEKNNKNAGFDRIDFWYHSLATAIIAERIAKNFKDLNLEEVFLAGLLHDLGIMLLDDFFPSIFNTVLSATAKEAGLFYNLEKKLLNVTHLDLIAELFPKWRIPQIITDSIIGQYTIPDMQEPITTPAQKIAACIALGNAVAKLLPIGSECDKFVVPFDNTFITQVKLQHGFISLILEYVHQKVAIFSQFLNLEKREYHGDFPNSINPETIVLGLCNPTGSIFIPPELLCKVNAIPYITISPDSDFTDLNGKCHAIIYWTTDPIDQSLLERLRHVERNSTNYRSASEASGTFAPLFVVAPQESGTDGISADGPAIFDNKLDYRILESKVYTSLIPLEPPVDVENGK